jgi:hypothetical protein
MESEFSVRTNEAIDSGEAKEGQTFEAQVTWDTKDANSDVAIPRGSTARVVTRPASRGGRSRGAIAGGGRCAAIGAGAGALTQVLAFQPDRPLRVSAVQ